MENNSCQISLKIAGEAGFGIRSSGIMLARIFMRLGYYTFEINEFPSIIRGGHNTFQLNIGNKKVNSNTKKIDILVALNKEGIKKNLSELNKNGIVIFNKDNSKLNIKNSIGIPLNKIAKDSGYELMRNVVALGAILALTKNNLTIAPKVIKETFKIKGENIVKGNIKALKAGFNYVKKHYHHKNICDLSQINRKEDNILIEGNQALALGAIAGGLNFYAAYPMTPSSSILHYLVKVAEKNGIVVKHAEDEISVINMALGASHVGARAMIGTSGGGFSLMTESLGLNSITETPLVIVNVQRPGPATGLPTWQEQADLQFVLRAAQGDFPRIIVAPGDVKESFEFGHVAMNLAEIYQMPVIILSDKVIGEGSKVVKKFSIKGIKINRGKLLNQKKLNKINNYKRYKLTSDGISPRSLPGMKNGLYLANSDEHDKYGFSNEDSKNRIEQVNKRAKKLETFSKLMPDPIIYGNIKAKNTIVIWGSTKGVVLDAYNELSRRQKKKIKILQIQYIWPFSKDFVYKVLKKSKNILLIENNSNAQLGQLIRQETGVEIKNKFLKYNGRPFWREEIIKILNKI